MVRKSVALPKALQFSCINEINVRWVFHTYTWWIPLDGHNSKERHLYNWIGTPRLYCLSKMPSLQKVPYRRKLWILWINVHEYLGSRVHLMVTIDIHVHISSRSFRNYHRIMVLTRLLWVNELCFGQEWLLVLYIIAIDNTESPSEY